jgi:peptidoglycan hydrolase-like protein with peptidoglycan-binding domain
MKKILFGVILISGLLISGNVRAVDFGQAVNFNIDSSYDLSARSEVKALLVKTTQDLYFYVEENWWKAQSDAKQKEILNNFDLLSQEFQGNIYPVLTSVYGSEWKPGIDGDSRIAVLFHFMKEGAAGYFRTSDEYLKLQSPDSNEREMLYLSLDLADNPQIKSYLAHEFVHLITFNQKNRSFGVDEEVWLNEARAEYASTILGYDDVYDNSNLKRRVDIFLTKPTDSVTEWQGTKYDYGSVNIFTHYLTDYYSVAILSDTLKSKLVGIASINEFLKQNNYKEDFSQIFTNWTIAVFANDCSLGKYYCYFNKNLKNLKISPSINFLPFTSKSSLSIVDVAKNWAGNWQKFIGGNGTFSLEFSSLVGLNFKVPYLLQEQGGSWDVEFLIFNNNQKSELSISDFAKKYKAIVMIPTLQTKISGFDGFEPTYPYSITVSVSDNTGEEENVLVNKLLAQIEYLKKEIARVQAQIDATSGKATVSCQKINNNLYAGIKSNDEVKCLQEFLSSQGGGIYPEKLITGNFGPLTALAVARFQEKYASEILTPYGLSSGNGYVGPKTIAKINYILTGGK